MPLTVRKFNAQVKDPTTGDMIPAGLLSSDSLQAIEAAESAAITEIQQKGAQTKADIPDDYTELSESVGELKTQIDDFTELKQSANFTDPSLTYGATINDDTGVITGPNNYYRCSDKIPVTPGETVYIYALSAGIMVVRKTVNDKVAFYKSNDTFISIGYNENSYTVPAEAAYCVQQGYNALMRDGKCGIFKQSLSELGTTWIPYSCETVIITDKTLTMPDVPADAKAVGDALETLQVETDTTLSQSDVPADAKATGNAIKAVESELKLTTGENLIDPEKVVFSQDGASNLTTDLLAINPGTKYTLSYSGAADIRISCWIKQYDADGEYLGDGVQTAFVFKAGTVTFVTESDAAYIKIYVYKSGGITPAQFPFSNPCLVYGPYGAITFVPYKQEFESDAIPPMPERLYTEKFDGMISLGHMGLSYYFPQNTKWSWLGAKKAGFDYIECDLQVTADDYIVLIHDPDMRRYGGTEAQTVESLTLAQLQTFDAGEWFAPRYTGTQFPIFDDFVGFAKALGINLALDCKQINTPERIDTVADILEKWGMQDNVIWITGQFAAVWTRVPNAKIMWATAATLINGQWEGTPDGWFASFAGNFPEDKKSIDGSGNTVVADGVWFCVDQSIAVADTYGLTDLQQTAELARKYNCKYGLYAIDNNDDIYNYITSIPYLSAITSNRITPQAAVCQKFGIGISNRPQDLKD